MHGSRGRCHGAFYLCEDVGRLAEGALSASITGAALVVLPLLSAPRARNLGHWRRIPMLAVALTHCNLKLAFLVCGIQKDRTDADAMTGVAKEDMRGSCPIRPLLGPGHCYTNTRRLSPRCKKCGSVYLAWPSKASARAC